jgi:hypothetical protein
LLRRLVLVVAPLLIVLLATPVRAGAQDPSLAPLYLECCITVDPWAGEPVQVGAWLRSESGEPFSGALRWSVSGITSVAERSATTNGDGYAELSYTAPHSGYDTLSAYADADGDEVHDDDEPGASLTIHWKQALPPPLTDETIDGSPLDITASSGGLLQARHSAAQSDLFESEATASGFFLYITSGSMTRRGYGHWPWMPFYGESQSAPVRTADTVTQDTTFTVREEDIDYARVRQTVRYRDGDSAFRVTYRVENLTDTPLSFRAGAGGHLLVDGADWGPPAKRDRPPRFVGGFNPATGVTTGLEEVALSRLPSDAVPVPVAPWTSSRHGYWPDVLHALLGGDGLSTMFETDADHGVGVEWRDHESAAEAIGPGPLNAARYEVVWQVRLPAGTDPAPGVTPTPTPAATVTPGLSPAPTAPTAPVAPRSAGTKPRLTGSSLDRRRRLVVRLRCPRASHGCTGTLTLLTRGTHRRIATLAYRLRPGQARRYRVRPSRRTRAAVRRHARVLARFAPTPRE